MTNKPARGVFTERLPSRSRMTDRIEGVALPTVPKGTVRRKVPDPYSRPSISLGSGPQAVRRQWQSVVVQDIQVGDLIPGIGLITSVHEDFRVPTAGTGLPAEQIADQVSWTVTLAGGADNTRRYRYGEQVWAFTAATAAG